VDGKGVGDAAGRFTMRRELRIGGTTHATVKANGSRMKVRIDSGEGNQMTHTRKGAGVVSTKTMGAAREQNGRAGVATGSAPSGSRPALPARKAPKASPLKKTSEPKLGGVRGKR
jgi:hypothetical protein